MTEIGIATLLLVIANIFCSVQGLNDHPSFERFTINVNSIILKKEYNRLISAGFFHVSWLHLFLNIASLFLFSGGIELHLGGAKYLLLYFSSLIGGNLFGVFVHRNHPNFTAAGASGAVNGIIFATIILIPGFKIGFMGTHFPIPAWFYGFLYVLFSMYGIKSGRDNIGHETQLAGGLAGLLMSLLLVPATLVNNYLNILAISIPTMFFIFIVITRPQFLLIDNKFFYQSRRRLKTDPIHHLKITDHQQEIDLILEKIHQTGMKSLTETEKEKLDQYSKMIQ